MDVSLLYLAGSPAALLENIIVEKEQLASAVYYATDDHSRLEVRFILTSVETKSLKKVEKRFFEVLKDAMDKDLDMKFLKECIDRHRRTWKYETESSPSLFAEYVISDFLFGKRDGSTLMDVATLKEYDVLENWTQDQWRDFIKLHISDAFHVTTFGVPSQKMVEKLRKDEEDRTAAQKERFGENGLKELADKLEKAKAENDKPIPEGLLSEFTIPGTDSISFMQTTTARSGAALKAGRPNNKIQDLIDADKSDSSFFIHFEHIPSSFVRLHVLISADSVPVQLRPLLSIYTEAFFKSPIQRDGKTVDFEQVVVQLERDTVGYAMETAQTLKSSEMLRVSFEVEIEKYESAITWLQELSWNSIFDVERLRAINKSLLADVPDHKRDGDAMLYAVNTMIHYANESISRARSTLVKARYLKRVKRILAENPEEIVTCMEQIRNSLFQPENVRVIVIADLEKLRNPVSAWKPFAETLGASKDLCPITKRLSLLNDAGKNVGGKSYIVPMPTIDSSFALGFSRGLDSYDHPSLPALMVATSYMNLVEGPLWVAARGTGLAYGAYFQYNIDTGFVSFAVYRSPNAHKAFEACKHIVEDHLSGATAFDPMMLEAAVSSIVVKFADEQMTAANAAQDSFIRQVVHKLPSDYNEKILQNVRAITIDQIKAALHDIVLPMFDPKKANLIVTCSSLLEEVSTSALIIDTC